MQAPGHGMVVGGVLQIAFNGLQKTIGNLTLECLGASEVIVEMADVCQLEPRVRQQGYGRENTEELDKATGSVAGIGRRYDEGMESRSIMVTANGMVHKLRKELKDDGALLFGLIFLAYLDIGGECFCLFFPLFAFMCTSYFGLALAVLSLEPTVQQVVI